MAIGKRQLIVFDFDWSLVDQDTDRYVFEVLDITLRRKMEDRKKTVQWTDNVAGVLKELHAKGVSKNQIQDTLRALPFHPAMIRAVSTLKASTASQNTFFCLSNSNQVFISTILEHKKLTDLFDEIITNPAEWDDSGLLKVRRRVDPNGPQHQCRIGCSANMCKGEELEAFLARHCEFDRVCYTGDGENDFCGLLRLRSQDVAFVRRGRGLEERVEKEGPSQGLKCQIKLWTDAWEIEEYFAQL